MTLTRFAVPDVSCEQCEESIEGALSPLEGVAHVEVDVRGKVVTVEHDPRVASVEGLAEAIEEQGYVVAGHDEAPGTAA